MEGSLYSQLPYLRQDQHLDSKGQNNFERSLGMLYEMYPQARFTPEELKRIQKLFENPMIYEQFLQEYQKRKQTPYNKEPNAGTLR